MCERVPRQLNTFGPKMPSSSKTSVTNFIRDAIKAGQIIQDRHIVINTRQQIPIVVVHDLSEKVHKFEVNNYVAIRIN